MKLQKKLVKYGIEKKEKIDHKYVNQIAHTIADKITNTFPILQNEYNEILAKLLNCKMYYAQIKEPISKVNYFYEDNCVYIDESVDILNPNEQFIHEIIHYLQAKRDNKGKIKKMGLCTFNDFSISELGINEAIVQYISAKVMKNEKKEIEICNLDIKTISPYSYPLLTSLMEQLIYVMGEDLIIESTIKADEKFETEFYNTFEEQTNKIIKNFDKILEQKNKLLLENDADKKEKLKMELSNLYLETQNIIMITFYEKIISKLTSIKEIDYYTNKFLNHKDIIEPTSRMIFEQNKKKIMDKFDRQLIKVSKQKSKNALIKYNGKIRDILKKIISYFYP